MKIQKIVVPILALLISGPLFGAAEPTPAPESPLMLSVQNETKLARSIDAFVSRRKRSRKTPLRYFLATPFAQSSRIQLLVQKALDMGGDITNNPEYRISWCVCSKASFGTRIVLLNKIIKNVLWYHRNKAQKLVITSLGAGFLLFEYLLISDLLHEGYSNILLIGIDHYNQIPTCKKNDINGEIPGALRNALREALAADSEVSVVYNSVPSVEEYIVQEYPRTDYFLIIDMNNVARIIDRDLGVPEDLSSHRYNHILLNREGSTVRDFAARIGFDISKERLGKAPRPAIALSIRDDEWREPIKAILNTVVETVEDQTKIAPAIIEEIFALDLPEDMQIQVCSLALNEVAYRHERLLHEGAQVFILTNGEARDVTGVFSQDEENIVVLRNKIAWGSIQ